MGVRGEVRGAECGRTREARSGRARRAECGREERGERKIILNLFPLYWFLFGKTYVSWKT